MDHQRQRRLLLIAIGVLVPVLLVTAGLVAHLAGAFGDRGRFDAVPPGCDTIKPFTGLLGVDYTLRPTERNYSCDLLLPQDHPGYLPYPKITVGFVLSSRDDLSPEAISRQLQQQLPEVRPLSGLGDEAYVQDRNMFVRVSNLWIVVYVFPNPASTDDQVTAFLTALVAGLPEH